MKSNVDDLLYHYDKDDKILVKINDDLSRTELKFTEVIPEVFPEYEWHAYDTSGNEIKLSENEPMCILACTTDAVLFAIIPMELTPCELYMQLDKVERKYKNAVQHFIRGLVYTVPLPLTLEDLMFLLRMLYTSHEVSIDPREIEHISTISAFLKVHGHNLGV